MIILMVIVHAKCSIKRDAKIIIKRFGSRCKILSDCLAGKWEKVWEKGTKNISLSFLEQSKCSECYEYIYKAITDFN